MNHLGAFPLQPGMPAAQALADAGGQTDEAELSYSVSDPDLGVKSGCRGRGRYVGGVSSTEGNSRSDRINRLWSSRS